MNKVINVAVLGSTGYVGLELIKILVNHPHIKINFLGCENISNQNEINLTQDNNFINLPKTFFK